MEQFVGGSFTCRLGPSAARAAPASRRLMEAPIGQGRLGPFAQ
jgi:hypothetical protein